MSAPSTSFFPEVRWCAWHFIIGGATADTRSGPASLEEAVGGIVRTWIDGLAEALAALMRARGSRHPRALPQRPSRGLFARFYSPRLPGHIRVIEGLSPSRPLGVDFHRRPGTKATDRAQGMEPCRPDPAVANGCGAGKHGFQVVDEQTTNAVGNPNEPDVWFNDMVVLVCARDGGHGRFGDTSRDSRPRSCRDERRRGKRRLQRAGPCGGLNVARGCPGARHLAVPAPDSRSLFPGLYVGDAG